MSKCLLDRMIFNAKLHGRTYVNTGDIICPVCEEEEAIYCGVKHRVAGSRGWAKEQTDYYTCYMCRCKFAIKWLATDRGYIPIGYEEG